jgi:hypothetical protein
MNDRKKRIIQGMTLVLILKKIEIIDICIFFRTYIILTTKYILGW